MNILIIVKTLSEKDGQGRYSLDFIGELAKRHKITVLSPDNYNLDLLGRLGVSVVAIPNLLNIRKGFGGALKYFRVFWRHLKQNDLVHFFADLPGYMIFSPLMLFSAKPYFVTAHGTYIPTSLDHGCYRYLIGRFLKKAKGVICVSNFTKNEILKRQSLANIFVINNGVHFDKFYNSGKGQADKGEEKIILTVGTLKKRKGFDIAIRAAGKIKKDIPNFKYYIVGDQSDKKYFGDLQKIVDESGLSENVIFLSNISDEELIGLYARARVFILTPVILNDNNFEGFGLVYLEANAGGIPVIGTKGCGAEDAIKDGYNGILVEQNNVDQTAEALNRILSDAHFAKQLGDNGVAWAKEFDWRNIYFKYQNIYDQFVK